jgi:N-acetylneuraminate synthase/N,N'-diacetyllegionaminate synthase
MNYESETVYFIAEAGVNHNGSYQRAIDLCSIAKDSGADAVKFQTWKTELLVLPGTPQAHYQSKNTGSDRDQYSMLKELELSQAEFERIKGHCDSIGIDFLSTPDEAESLRFLVQDLGLKTIKIGSGELGNIPLLREAQALAEHIILSTGMSSMSDVVHVVEALGRPDPERLTLLHCTSTYPCPARYANLRVLTSLTDAFPYRVGYSDHTLGIAVPLAAIALGARVIEKHFTQSISLPGPDHACSLEPTDLCRLIEGVRAVSSALGSKEKSVQSVEEDTRRTVTKIIVARHPLEAGTPFSAENITLMRAGVEGICGFQWDFLMRRVARRSYEMYEPIDATEIG